MSNILKYSPNFRTITENERLFCNSGSITFENKGNSIVYIDTEYNLESGEHLTISSNIANAILEHTFDIKFVANQEEATQINKLCIISINFSHNVINGN
jgi:hypothetical protein